MLEQVHENNSEKITTYGPKKLHCSTGIFDSKWIILVEGRADIINLLRAGYDNALAFEGGRIDESIKEICEEKEKVVAFTDGDRAGGFILKELKSVVHVDLELRADTGIEVEELTPKRVDELLSPVKKQMEEELSAPEIKNVDEITLLNQAAAMVDGVYHMMYEELKPGVRENDIVAWANKMLYEHGSDDVEAINAISGERCSPHPHNFTDRLLRPGDQAFFDIIQSYVGYRTCYYRTLNVCFATPAQQDAYKQCREWLDSAIELIKPGVSTDRVASVWPKAEEFGFPSEMDAFGLQFGHGLDTLSQKCFP